MTGCILKFYDEDGRLPDRCGAADTRVPTKVPIPDRTARVEMRWDAAAEPQVFDLPEGATLTEVVVTEASFRCE